MEYGRQDELVVNGDGHVARLVERRRHRPHGVAQVHRPQQEEELSCEEREKRNTMKTLICSAQDQKITKVHAHTNLHCSTVVQHRFT